MGPYHPALPQPIALTFKLRGEKIVAVDPPRTGYCRRGIEAHAAGKPASQALDIVERSCGFAGQSHRLAVCMAIETATGAAPSPRARLVRALFAEVERMLARLWMLGMTARAANLQAPLREALEQRELLYDALAETTGERVFWAISEPGGVRRFEEHAELAPVRAAVEQLSNSVETWHAATSPRGPLGRAGAGVGRITHDRARDFGMTGMAARGSGDETDLRRDAPYSGYADVAFEWQTTGDVPPPAGDVSARMAATVADLATSYRLALDLLEAIPGADDTSLVDGRTKVTGAREGNGTVEGPHGPVEATITVSPAGTVDHLSLRSSGPSALVVALPEILAGQPVGLAPLVLASLDLCVECVDL